METKRKQLGDTKNTNRSTSHGNKTKTTTIEQNKKLIFFFLFVDFEMSNDYFTEYIS